MSKYVYKTQLIGYLKCVTSFGIETLFVFRGIVVADYLGKISPPFLFIQKTNKKTQTKNKFSVVIINSNSARIKSRKE